MCGIFGISNLVNENIYGSLLEDLYIMSESRGQDASGIAIEANDKLIVHKRRLPARTFIRTAQYKKAIDSSKPFKFIIGHTRMETNGSSSAMSNNQPVVKDGFITVHNGIIVNDARLWADHPEMQRRYQIDTEVINSLLKIFIDRGHALEKALHTTTSLLEGAYSLAILTDKYEKLLLTTNTGSLYALVNKAGEMLLFASEKYYLNMILEKNYFENNMTKIKKVAPGEILIVDLSDKNGTKQKTIEEINGLEKHPIVHEAKTNDAFNRLVTEEYKNNKERIMNLKRCSRCILPETMPFIQFDDKGVCNYCNTYAKPILQGEKILVEIADRQRNKDGNPDCIVAFSGGRDSSYALHYVKNCLKLNPLAFSYDWGMLTDIGRRNQAIMTGKLGVEHILVSANIKKKRANIRKNVEAWLKMPSLGTVPLFMAGDKQYFYHVNRVRKEYGIPLVIMGENQLEKTAFKNGFAGFKQSNQSYMAYNVSYLDKIKMLFYYAAQFARNPAYLNSSIPDTIGAYISYFFVLHDYLNLYNYIDWEENKINEVLINEYGWETSPEIDSTWRIGDGTAAFYNYIYYTVAGFTENDTFRSNQIRSGMLSRKEALLKVEKENIPRASSINWYGNTIGVDMFNGIKIINSMRKLYV